MLKDCVVSALMISEGSGIHVFLKLENGLWTNSDFQNAIAAIWHQRADRYSEIRSANTPRIAKVEMSYIGG